MGDATPSAARPEVLTAAQEMRLLSGAVREALGHLRWNWGDAYGIGMLPGGRPGTFAAWRLDGQGDVLTSEDPAELLLAIRADYDARPVPRGMTAP